MPLRLILRSSLSSKGCKLQKKRLIALPAKQLKKLLLLMLNPQALTISQRIQKYLMAVQVMVTTSDEVHYGPT